MWGGRNRRITSVIFTSCVAAQLQSCLWSGRWGQSVESNSRSLCYLSAIEEFNKSDNHQSCWFCAGTHSENQARPHWCKHFRCVCYQCHRWCRLTVLPISEGHVHESHRHQAASEHTEQSEAEQEEALSKGTQSVAIFSSNAAVHGVIDNHGFQPRATWGDTNLTLTAIKARTSMAGWWRRSTKVHVYTVEWGWFKH